MSSLVYRYRCDLATYVRAVMREGTTPQTVALWEDLNRRWPSLPFRERVRLRWGLWKLQVTVAWIRWTRR